MNKSKVLQLVANPAKLKALPTKYSPSVRAGPVRVIVQGAKVKIVEITADDFDQFAKIKKIESAPPKTVSERAFKDGIQALIGETGKFQDWGVASQTTSSRRRHE
ncbi:MAG: hypothetical protein WDN03_02140 [Rhizomicrobium sp.]